MDTVALARDVSLTVLAFMAIVVMVTGLVVMIRLYRQVTHLLISARRIGEQGEMAAEIITGGIIQPIARGVALAALVGTGLVSDSPTGLRLGRRAASRHLKSDDGRVRPVPR